MKALYVFPEKCTGCRECSLACSLTKFGECNPKRAAIRVFRDEFKRYEYQRVCRQCEDPECLNSCPEDAYEIIDNVIVLDRERCTGCGICVASCPYGSVFQLNDEIIKCDLCGGNPQCIRFCTTGAVQYLEKSEELEAGRNKTDQSINDFIKS